jgi:hypothetical protein
MNNRAGTFPRKVGNPTDSPRVGVLVRDRRMRRCGLTLPQSYLLER